MKWQLFAIAVVGGLAAGLYMRRQVERERAQFRSDCEFQSNPDRMFTVEELALYNGTDEALPTYLAIMGEVFDGKRGRDSGLLSCSRCASQ